MELLAPSVSTCKHLLMAEINTGGGGGHQHKGVRRSKKLSTKVDLTPMVDLGFLLITFFMLTSVWAKPKALDVDMPANGPESKIGENATLTVFPISGDKAFYYHGSLSNALINKQYGTTGFSLTGGIGDIIRQKQRLMDKSYKGGKKEMMVIIKPSTTASYKSIVDMLDEMLINGVGRYALTDITADEKTILNANNMGWVLN